MELIKFNVTHQKLQAWENYLVSEKKGIHPQKVKRLNKSSQSDFT